VRELVGVLSRALVFAAEELEPQHLPEPLSRPPAVPPRDAGALTLTTRFGSSFREARRAFERAYLREVLETHGGVIARAARTLGMDRGQLSRVVRRLGLR
jgi:transcriptional regulator with GAF, ATPase, and Fis domain